MTFRVLQYVDTGGHVPFRVWLSQLDVAVRARVQARILRFECGNLGNHKDVGEGKRAQTYWADYLKEVKHGET